MNARIVKDIRNVSGFRIDLNELWSEATTKLVGKIS